VNGHAPSQTSNGYHGFCAVQKVRP
jgi:hypothetical protein